MESQKEIGRSIKEKLDGNKATLEAPVWERIQETLQKEKRRRLLFNWSLNGLIILCTIGGFALLTTTNSEEKEMFVDTNTRSKIKKIETSEQNKKEVVVPILEKADPQLYETKETILAINKVDNPSTSKEVEIPNDSKKNMKVKEISKPQVKETSTDNSEETSATRTETMYYYYNSKDGQEVTSKNKKVIDSTVQANSIKKDSLH